MILKFLKTHWLFVLLLGGFPLVSAISLAQICLSEHNTLLHNGNWRSTKTTLAKGVMGAQAFVLQQQPLMKGRLNLGAWHGYQEVIYKDKLDVRTLECEFLLEKDAYVSIIFDKCEQGFSGARFSVHPRFASVFFHASPLGEFQEKASLGNLPLPAHTWLRLRIRFDDRNVLIWLNRQALGAFRRRLSGQQLIGFRGSEKGAFVDDVFIRRRDGSCLHESFSNQRGAFMITLFALLAVLGLSVLAIPIFRLFARARGRLLTFHLIILNGLVSLVSGAAYAYQYVTGAYYPIVDAEMQRNEEAFMSSVTVKTINEIRAAYHRRPGKNVCRILFLGTSQTWGAGVARPDDTFVCLFESLLNRAAPKNCSFECVNGGIAAADAAWLLAVYERFWISLSPRTVFIILANNDRNAQRFAVTIDQMIAISLAAGIQPILVLEPNSIEADCRSLAFKHAVMTAIGKTRQVPVIDMQRYLSEKADEGFVWWDSVHLTSFGHRLAAQKLYTEFLRQFHGACPQPE